MSAVSETIVREYFELHGFLIRQHRKYVAPNRKEEDDQVDFFVCNPHPQPRPDELPFVLGSAELLCVEKAIVVVKGWHTETFSLARLTSAPKIFRFVQPKAFQHAVRAFGADGTPLKILVVPALPREAEAHRQSIELLRSKGVDAVIPFRTMLADLVNQTEANRNYRKSDLLQIIRILKSYDLLKDPQLELFKPSRRKKSVRSSERRP
jgi:hypothetical protein